MHQDSMAICATCVRVPVYFGHGESVNIELENPMNPEDAKRILSTAPGVSLLDNPSKDIYPLPIDAEGQDDVFVGRIRKDESHPNGLVMWVVADNIRKGAALNTIQIAEKMLGH